MAVAAAIVVGAVFLIVHFTSPSTDATAIIDAAYETKFVEKYEKSYAGLSSFSTSQSKKKVINLANKMNAFLIEYYEHYLTQSGFELQASGSKRSVILNKMDELLLQVDKTKEFLDLTKAGSVPQIEINKRFEKTAGFYLEQTKMLFELDGLMKDYVLEVNYQSGRLGSTYEMQLQMVMDYAKAIFDKEIYGHFDDSLGENVSSTRADRFEAVLDKFNNRQKANSNSNVEVAFFLRYPVIDKQHLTEFYCNTNDKQNYVYSIENETTHDALVFLLNYINQSSF